MRRTVRISVGLLTAAAAIVLCLGIALRHRELGRDSGSLPAAFPEAMPRRVVWAWEQPEDLRSLPPTVGVAYLAETLLLGRDVGVLPRRQPLHPAAGAPLMAVVRIETRPGFTDTPALRSEVAERIAAAARRGGPRALQVDFDATVSERAFYRGLLNDLRRDLPPGMPLSITALASWCGPDSWLHGLPVDEAVPMFFRMGGPRLLSTAPGPTPWPITEPLCRGSLGVATDEPWPRRLRSGTTGRVYVFAPRPWQGQQLTAFATSPLNSLEKELLR